MKSIAVLSVAAGVAAGAVEAADAPRVTISARPTVAGPAAAVVFAGALSTRANGEFVSVEAKECGAPGYHAVAGGQTAGGGFWTARTTVVSTTAFRARWKSVVSAPVVVRTRPMIRLDRLASGRGFRAMVTGGSAPLRGRYVELQRRTQDGRWVRVSRAPLKISEFFGAFEVDFRVRRRGLLLRAYLPRASATPCFLPGPSEPVRS